MTIEVEHEGRAETDMAFGDVDQANGVTLIEFVWIYLFGFLIGICVGIIIAEVFI